jgi:hypothetical protein
MRADAGSLDLDVVFFLSFETVDSLTGRRIGLAHERRSRYVNQACFGQAGAIRMILKDFRATF